MGAIMAIGIAVANAILLVTFAEAARRDGASVARRGRRAARGRLRADPDDRARDDRRHDPDGARNRRAAQTAPLGRAVIGGLFFATLATLIVLPAVYSLLQQRVTTASPTLDPDDPSSTLYEPRT